MKTNPLLPATLVLSWAILSACKTGQKLTSEGANHQPEVEIPVDEGGTVVTNYSDHAGGMIYFYDESQIYFINFVENEDGLRQVGISLNAGSHSKTKHTMYCNGAEISLDGDTAGFITIVRSTADCQNRTEVRKVDEITGKKLVRLARKWHSKKFGRSEVALDFESAWQKPLH